MNATSTVTASNVAVASFVVAAAAFVISVLTLYYTRLRRANIRLTLVSSEPAELLSEHWTTGPKGGPNGATIRVPMVLTNFGARNGVLSRFVAAQYEEVGPGEPAFEIRSVALSDVRPPVTIEAGTAQMVRGVIGLGAAYHGRDQSGGVVNAWLLERLATKTSLKVTLRYSTLRTGFRGEQEHSIPIDVLTEPLRREWARRSGTQAAKKLGVANG